MCRSFDAIVFELDYDVERKDIQAYQSHFWSRSRTFVVIVHSLFILMLSAFGLLISFLIHQTVNFFGQDWPPELNLLYVVCAVAAVFFGYEQTKARYGTLLNALKPDDLGFDEQLALGNRHLTVSQSNIAIRGPTGESVRQWIDVTSIETNGEHIFIYADVGFFIPHSAFSSDAERQRFASAVKQWHARSVDTD